MNVYLYVGKSNKKKIKVCRFEIIDGFKYIYCIKHAYKFLLSEEVGFAAVLWRLRQCVSCLPSYAVLVNLGEKMWCMQLLSFGA